MPRCSSTTQRQCACQRVHSSDTARWTLLALALATVARQAAATTACPDSPWVAGEITATVGGAPLPLYIMQQRPSWNHWLPPNRSVDGNITVNTWNDPPGSRPGGSITLRRSSSLGGPRAYIAKGPNCPSAFSPDVFWKPRLLGQAFSFTVDLSKAGCGCNAALYTVSMPAIKPDGSTPDPTVDGDYYCDANGLGGSYCPEMDIMEGNRAAIHVTPHKCSPPLRGKYYNGSCDGGGLWGGTYSFKPGRFGPGGANGSIVDTLKPFRVEIQFFGSESSPAGGARLANITTTFTQNASKGSLQIYHADKAYLQTMAPALAAGQVFVMSLWGGLDPGHGTLGWLDSPPCDGGAACDKDAEVVLSDFDLTPIRR